MDDDRETIIVMHNHMLHEPIIPDDPRVVKVYNVEWEQAWCRIWKQNVWHIYVEEEFLWDWDTVGTDWTKVDHRALYDWATQLFLDMKDQGIALYDLQGGNIMHKNGEFKLIDVEQFYPYTEGWHEEGVYYMAEGLYEQLDIHGVHTTGNGCSSCKVPAILRSARQEQEGICCKDTSRFQNDPVGDLRLHCGKPS